MESTSYGSIEFRGWTHDVFAEIARWATGLRLWRGAGASVRGRSFGPYSAIEGSVETCVAGLEEWVADSRAHIEEIVQIAQPTYHGVVYAAVRDETEIDLSPMMEMTLAGEYQRHTGAQCVIVRPRASLWRLYASSEESWEVWKAEERELAPITRTAVERAAALESGSETGN